MIITQTPFRVSFVGGGTDLKEYYKDGHGAVVSTTIRKYIYVTAKKQNRLHPHRIRVSYSKTENVTRVDEIEHPIVREALKFLSIDEPLEINVIADVPARTGLGSSSTFTVGLLHALHALKEEHVSRRQLAEEACHIEIDVLGRPIGKQDHYAAAFGGLNYIRFNSDESVLVDPVIVNRHTRERFFGNLMMFYTGMTRDSHSILAKQKSATAGKMDLLHSMKDMTIEAKGILEEGSDLDKFGSLLDRAWKQKSRMVEEISNKDIESHYQVAKKAGAIGGKLLGAGGGGFWLFYVPAEKQDKVRTALGELVELEMQYEPQGSRIIFYE